MKREDVPAYVAAVEAFEQADLDYRNAPNTDDVDAKIEELQAQIRKLLDERSKTELIRRDLRRNRQKSQLDLQDAALDADREIENAKAAEALEAQRINVDAITATATWRVGSSDGRRIFAHQLDGAHFLSTALCNVGGALCADGMGLGKTIESIATLDMIQAKRVLVVCPGEVMSGYFKEFRRWAPTRAVTIIGRQAKAERNFLLDTLADAPLDNITLIINYEAWRRDQSLLFRLQKMQFDTVIMDEAHVLKDPASNAFKGVRSIVSSENTCVDCGKFVVNSVCTDCNKIHNYGLVAEKSVKHRLVMTGTPILNRPDEIWALLNLVSDQLFDNRNRFLRTFCDLEEDGKYYFKPGGMSRLAGQLQGFYIRRTMQDTGITLPPQEIQVHEIELDAEDYPLQSELIRMLKENAQMMYDNGQAASTVSLLALITRQRQAATWPGGIVIKEPVYDEWGFEVIDPFTEKQLMKIIPIGEEYRESVKMDRAISMMKDFVNEGHRVVVFSQFRTALDEGVRRSNEAGIRTATFHGGTSASERDAIKSNFDRSLGEVPQYDAVFVHYKTGGVGLNLTAATVIIILDEEWNPGRNNQAYDRINRIGQTEDTQVHILRLVGPGAIDVWMAELNETKGSMIAEFNQEQQSYQELNKMLMEGFNQ